MNHFKDRSLRVETPGNANPQKRTAHTVSRLSQKIPRSCKKNSNLGRPCEPRLHPEMHSRSNKSGAYAFRIPSGQALNPKSHKCLRLMSCRLIAAPPTTFQDPNLAIYDPVRGRAGKVDFKTMARTPLPSSRMEGDSRGVWLI